MGKASAAAGAPSESCLFRHSAAGTALAADVSSVLRSADSASKVPGVPQPTRRRRSSGSRRGKKRSRRDVQRVSSKGGEEAFLTSSSSHGHWEELPEAGKEKAEKEKWWSGGVCECVRDAPNARGMRNAADFFLSPGPPRLHRRRDTIFSPCGTVRLDPGPPLAAALE
ncbi:hypothetical protein HPB51_001705 [Rhipicephalus microplus]|uniref:Uncharacterized protein n=1 Tax=Rhipicephalus microplus TaxID=6941 RepID=A0A9J6DE60_RHIMP|nr:hypothetical protein HPB51_001705 [Rhipicephalus microplus]